MIIPIIITIIIPIGTVTIARSTLESSKGNQIEEWFSIRNIESVESGSIRVKPANAYVYLAEGLWDETVIRCIDDSITATEVIVFSSFQYNK
eukprot:Pgem_evm1s10269